MIRVVVADDQTLVRSAFAVMVDATDDMQVVGRAADGVEAVNVVEQYRPDVVLMDIRMPRMDGLEATRRILDRPGPPHVLVLTTFDLDEYVFEALASGAAGFLLKDAEPHDLLAGIRTVAAGEALLAPRALKLLVQEFAGRRAGSRRPGRAPGRLAETLTEREQDVLRLIAEGRSNPEICAELRVGPATVKTHVTHLLQKLQARDRAQLVVIAHTSGFMA